MNAVVGAKKGSKKQRQPVISPDSAQSKTFIKVLYGLAEGEIEGLANGLQSIYLEETPLQNADGSLNFENVKVDFRNGTNDQEYIEGFPAVESETAIDVELKSETPWVRAFSNLDLDAVRLRLKWGPLRSQNATNGDVSGVTIEYAIDLQTDGGVWTEVLKTKISDKTSENYERAHRIDLPRADSGWLVRVRRLTPNSSSEYISDKMYIAAVTEVIDAKLRYPNTALLGLQYDAETFGNVAKVAADTKGRILKVPTNYNPSTRQYVGMWDGTFKEAYSNNPAWIYYDICTVDRYALGDRLTPLMVDKWSLYRLAQYCDQMVPDGLGGQEPRFTCNVYLQSAEGAFEILTKLAGVFRAITFWDGNSIICDADIPQDTYFTYTRANVIDGNFEYAGTRARDRHNVVKIAWDNPANHYKTEYEFVRDEKAIAEAGQVRILEIDAWGCTSRGQAQRAGHWALKSEQLETRTVSFKVGLDGHIPLPGKVIEVADPLFAGRANGGRVSAISADRKSITLDRDDVVAVAGDRLIINGEDGKAQARIVQSISGRVVNVTHEFDAIATQNVWVMDAQDLATMKFRVISITQDEHHQFSVTALQYNPAKFDAIDKGAYFDEVPISIVNPTIQDPVTNVVVTSESRVDQGINVATMIVSWTQAKGAVKYQVEWRKDDGSWIKLPITGNNSVEVPGIYAGQYQARVTAISAFEIASLPVYSTLTELSGKQGLPPKLAFIQATGILFGIKLDWGFPATGALDTAYTEIQVSPDGTSNIAQLGLFAYPTTTHTIQGLQPNLTQFYRGRLIDRIGNIGPWSDWTHATTSADATDVLELLNDQISESQLNQDLKTKIDHIETIDAEIGPLKQDIQNTKDRIAQEVKDRKDSVQQAVDQANNSLAIERDARIKDIDSTNQLIAQEVQDRINADFSEQKAREAAILAEAKLRDTAITSEKEERISGDDHLSQRIDTVSASSSDNAAAIQREEKARTDADSALGQRIDTVVAQAGDNAAAIQQEANARVEGDSANALLIETVRAESIENDVQTRALVTDESKARIDADRALAERVTGVEVVTKPALIGSESDLIGNDAGYAGVWSILSAVQEGDLLQAKRTDQVIVSVNDNAASINSEQIARIEGDKVVTKALTDYRASNDLALANVRQTAESAVSNSESNAKALTELDSRVNTVDANANEAKQNAASAISKAETAVSEAGSAASIAQQAHAEASTAATTANNAADNANEAKQTSATALSQANVAADQSAANAEQIQSIKVDLKDKASTGDIVQVKSDIKDVDNKITAQTTRIDGVYAQINPPLIGSDSDLIGNDGGYAGVWSEQSARIESDLVVSKRVDSTNAVLGDLQAYTQQEVQSRIEGDKITVQKIDNYIASNDSALATVRQSAQVAVEQSSANAEAIDLINLELDDKASTGQLTQIKSDIKNVDDKVLAQTIRLDGVYAQINPPLIGSESELIGNEGGYAGVWSEQSARIEGDLAQSKRTDQVSAQMNESNALFQQQINANASAISSTIKVTETLQTKVGKNSSSIQNVSESVDGIYAQQFIKFDVNGHVSGHGSMNDGTTSTFIFNYDRIQFGTPVGIDGIEPKPLMTLQNKPVTLPNGTVIPRGLYVDNGSFGYINANRIWAENLSVISADLGTIKVKTANIEDGAIDTLKIKDEAVTVPIGVKAIDIKTINSFSGGSTGGLPNNDFNNHLSAWENHIGTLLQVTLNRSGGKVRIDASVNICTPTFGAFSVSDGRGNPIAANDRAMASFYISIYKNGSLIGRGSLGANIETGNINVNFNGTAVIVSAIDDNSTIGNVTYTLKAGFARQEGVNIPLNVESRSNFMITSRTLSVIEMKK
ncbi:TPA: host specificity protein J [Acinetobacter baumannii]|nr:host specificity protein [Acinetobacter baumannii]HAV4654082.1 host specificity protein [Acinetobacter baumannii]HAV4729761.1 host specificity protein [Acinetobacter baumannii]HAV4806320.1 host specificity protein [Acinetobacter baumannii]HAV4894378.1 host specificity protein [Acinetobacter baumannii]